MAYIYHYTSLHNFVSMISNNQLRLVRLDKFISRYETNYFPKELSHEAPLKKRFEDIFISSWTRNAELSIAYWKLYSNLSTGIRIRINAEEIFEDDLQIPITKFETEGLIHSGTSFRIKKSDKKLYLKNIECVNQTELKKLFLQDIFDLPREEWEGFKRMQNNIFNLSLNNLFCEDEIRLQLEFNRIPEPSNKNAQREYSFGLTHDDDIFSVLVKLPEKFFYNANIIVSPDFSNENLALLKSFIEGKNINLETSNELQKSRSYLFSLKSI